MTILLAVTIGVLVTIALLQLQQRDIVRMVIGLYILWNATNLLLVGVAAIRGETAPLIDGSSRAMADPLVQAFVLTAIIITFGFLAFLAALILWLARSGESIDVAHFTRGRE
jgi:multicomponent Na+:H+ antiporter subunit C